MTGPADIDALAAEYVLGTLDVAERTAVAARLQREPALRAAVSAWEARLGPIAELAMPVAPPPSLAASIGRRIEAMDAAQSIPRSAPVIAPIIDATSLDLQRRLKRWRTTAIAASAMAASLAVVIGVREYARPSAEQNFVAVFQKDDASPSFVMSVDIATRTLSVRRVAADVPAGKTYQLWIASDKLGAAPQSLGLVEGQTTQVRSSIDPGIVQNAMFGVSLEPAGGSPTGRPTGPVFHARLIPTSP